MKSTIYKALIGATLIIGLSSCVNNWLDVEPGDQVEADEAVTTSADLSSVRAGMGQISKEHPTLRTIMLPVCFITVRYEVKICKRKSPQPFSAML
ncbi:hypothetical protein NXY34_23535 [Bacteroides fragilis]|nr:hypothetical protein [Bacteroides fragilis]